MKWVVNATPRPLYPPPPPGKNWYPLYKRLGGLGPRTGLDGCGKYRPPPGFDTRTVRPVASRYTDWVIPAGYDQYAWQFAHLCTAYVGLPNPNSQVRNQPLNLLKPSVNCSLYGLDGPGIEPRWRRDFPHLPRPALGITQPLTQRVPGHSGNGG